MPEFSTDTATKIEVLRGMSRLGSNIETYELIEVQWPSPTGTIYYSVQQLDDLLPESKQPPVSPIVCRVEPDSMPDWFVEIENEGSIGDNEFNIEMWDADGTIAQHLIDHGEGVKVTTYFWFPQVELFLPQPGSESHLKLEEEALVDTIKLKAVQGLRDAEGKLPAGGHFQHCWSVFGGLLETAELIAQNPCNYDLHIGGSVGTNDPDTGLPWTFCDRLTTQSCIDRGVDPLRHFSHRTITATIINNQTHGGNLRSTSEGNETNLPEPPRVIMGTRRVYNCPVVAFRRDLNNNHPDQGWFYALYEVGYGPHGQFSQARFTVDNATQTANPLHYNYRLGTYGQTAVSNLTPHGYSGIGLLLYNFGWCDPSKVDPSNASGSVITTGINNIRVYDDPDDLTSYTEGTSKNRAWQLVEMLTNKVWGYGYDVERLNMQTFIDTAAWCGEQVRFTDTFNKNWDHIRAESNVELIGKKVQEQFEDMCRAGRLSRPFMFDGKIHIVPLKALTSDELAAAPVFYEDGEDRNIIREDNRSTLKVSRKSDIGLVNQVKVTFDDRSQDWIEQPLRPVEDEAAQLRAGRVVGDHSRKINGKSWKLLGVDYEPQAVKLAWSLLDLGEFDEGGLQNNLELKFRIWYLDSLTLHPTKVIRVVSDRLAKYKSPQDVSFEYFRVKKMVRKSNLEVELTVQAYNVDYMDAFETAFSIPPGGDGGYCDVNSDCGDGYFCFNGVCVPVIDPGPCRPGIASVTFGDGVVTLQPIIC